MARYDVSFYTPTPSIIELGWAPLGDPDLIVAFPWVGGPPRSSIGISLREAELPDGVLYLRSLAEEGVASPWVGRIAVPEANGYGSLLALLGLLLVFSRLRRRRGGKAPATFVAPLSPSPQP